MAFKSIENIKQGERWYW